MSKVAVQDRLEIDATPARMPALVPSNSITPMEMLDRALASGAAPETLGKLMDLQERWEKNQARKEFDAAIAAAKAEIKPVVRNKEGHNSKRYVDFAAIARAVDPIITRHGLSYRFRSDQGDRISVTCILSHSAGHYEETTLTGPADTSGSKNAIQAIGSTLTYLQRYSLVQMLGIAASDDDDGDAAGIGEYVNEAQLKELLKLADDVGADKIKFCKYKNYPSFAEIPAKKFAEAKSALEAKRAKS